MNTKRQTIWLVSMLSLMVVLSAYYLFTEDIGSGNSLNADTVQGPNESAVGPDAGSASAADPTADQITVDEVADSMAEKKANPADGGAAGSEASGGNTANTDAEVLEQIASQGTTAIGGDTITRLQMGQLEAFNKRMDELYSIVSDTSNDAKKTTDAVAEIDRLDEKKSKITDLEQQLLASFPKAVVAEENDTYKVVVQSAKLERSQAADIIDKVMKTMGVSADRVSVQFVP